MTSYPSAPRPASTAVVFLLGAAVGLVVATVIQRMTRNEDVELFRSVYDIAGGSYVDEVDERELVEDGVRGMLRGLDRYSRYYAPAEVAALERETSGEFRGIGVVFRRPVTKGQVLFPFPGSPAAESGIEAGDTFLTIDGRVVEDLAAGELQKHIQGAGANPIDFLVRDLAGEERKVEIVPERVVDPTVRHAHVVEADHGIGYLSILSFSHRTPGEFDEALRYLEQEGASSLIVDLRGNPGGILDAAALVANRFIAEGRIVATKTRELTQVVHAQAEETTHAGMPLVLLVDENSASASEVLAGALQDHSAAVLVGTHTYGKGTVQTITPLRSFDARVKVTTATYYTPSWRRIERNGDDTEASGIAPDVQIALSDEDRKALYAHLYTYSPPPAVVQALRAWEAQEDTTLIDPHPRDAQLEAAIELLQ